MVVKVVGNIMKAATIAVVALVGVVLVLVAFWWADEFIAPLVFNSRIEYKFPRYIGGHVFSMVMVFRRSVRRKSSHV